MRIGIISDTHDQVARTGRAVARLAAEGAQALIHCGDVTRPPVIHECGGLPSYYVFGNNDFDDHGLRAAMRATGAVCLERGGEITLEGRRIAVTHGDSAAEIRRLAQSSPDYLLFGHSHEAHDQRDGAIRWINPGALYRARTLSVALLELETDTLQFLEIEKT